MDRAVSFDENCCIGSLASDTLERDDDGEDAYQGYGSDDSEEGDEEMRLFWDACEE